MNRKNVKRRTSVRRGRKRGQLIYREVWQAEPGSAASKAISQASVFHILSELNAGAPERAHARLAIIEAAAKLGLPLTATSRGIRKVLWGKSLICHDKMRTSCELINFFFYPFVLKFQIFPSDYYIYTRYLYNDSVPSRRILGAPQTTQRSLSRVSA